jgi:hypothetical protein
MALAVEKFMPNFLAADLIVHPVFAISETNYILLSSSMTAYFVPRRPPGRNLRRITLIRVQIGEEVSSLSRTSATVPILKSWWDVNIHLLLFNF